MILVHEDQKWLLLKISGGVRLVYGLLVNNRVADILEHILCLRI